MAWWGWFFVLVLILALRCWVQERREINEERVGRLYERRDPVSYRQRMKYGK